MIDFASQVSHYQSKVHRIVESQEKVATMKIVDTLAEQTYLEQLIEQTKPSLEHLPARHYLIQTPFRYPPLKHGSRFGSRFEPSIFYAGQTLQSALCESAFYSFYFMSRCLVAFDDIIMNHKTSFLVGVESSLHIDLTQLNDAQLQKKLTHKTDYTETQRIGKQMREFGITSFSFTSARCHQFTNVGVFDIQSIQGDPIELKQWEIKQTAKEILFFCPMMPQLSESFEIGLFLVDGVLPHPSN